MFCGFFLVSFFVLIIKLLESIDLRISVCDFFSVVGNDHNAVRFCRYILLIVDCAFDMRECLFERYPIPD